MNLLEQYIVEIINEEDFTEIWKKEVANTDEIIVRAIVKVNCYGRIDTQEWVGKQSEWQDIKQKGYYLA